MRESAAAQVESYALDREREQPLRGSRCSTGSRRPDAGSSSPLLDLILATVIEDLG
jgi:hypothetical protein